VRVPPRPTVYEINTAVWLERLGRPAGLEIALANPEIDAGTGRRCPTCATMT